MPLVWVSLGLLVGVWAGYLAADARWSAHMGRCFEEMGRRITATHGHVTAADWAEVFERKP